MKDYLNKKVLVTTSSWFYGRDGKQYRCLHGTLKAIHEVSKTFGFIPNRAHANWTVEIGDMTIMGCQVMYVEQCDNPHLGSVEDYLTDTNGIGNRPSHIYQTT